VALLPPKKDYNLPSTGLLRPLLGTIFSDSISFIAHTRKDHDPFWKQVWKSVVQYLADQTALLASVISFLDVFITFFTGELSEQTGVLWPKKFFKRWILPGVLLQLLVNPNMKDVAGIIKNFNPVLIQCWTCQIVPHIYCCSPYHQFHYCFIS